MYEDIQRNLSFFVEKSYNYNELQSEKSIILDFTCIIIHRIIFYVVIL